MIPYGMDGRDKVFTSGAGGSLLLCFTCYIVAVIAMNTRFEKLSVTYVDYDKCNLSSIKAAVAPF